MNRRSFTLLAGSSAATSAAGLIATAGSGRAASQPATGVRTVLELFTSQGCSSCPVADALFEGYTKRNDALALTLPVDYWDYLGWKDTLASAKFTQRQRGYAKTRGDGQIYTPQLVVNGAAHVNGADAKAIERQMAAVGSKPQAWVPLQIEREAEALTIAAGALDTGGEKPAATLWLATISKRVDVSVKRGENAGKSLSYFNVVRDMTAIGMWNGEAATVKLARAAIAQKGEDACAVVLQAGMSGRIIGAAMLAKL